MLLHPLSNFQIQKYYQNEPTTTHKIFETNSSFHVKQRKREKFSFCFKSFLLVGKRFLFWHGDWALGYHSMEFRHFPDIS